MNEENTEQRYVDVATCNLKETSIFPISDFKIQIRSDDTDIMCFHVVSIKDGYDVCLYIHSGKLINVLNYGNRSHHDRFDDVVAKAKRWLKAKPTHPKLIGWKSNREHLEDVWEMEHADEYFIIGNLYVNPWLAGNIWTKHTGVDATVWFTFKQRGMPPSIFIDLNKDKLSPCLIAVSFDDHPKIIAPQGAKLPPALWWQVLKWIKLNKETLLKYWNGEIGTMGFFEAMKKIT